MRAVVQRVSKASVTVDQQRISEIGKGLQILVGISSSDTPQDSDWLCNKLLNMRLFPDGDKPWQRSVVDVHGDVLCVSQFTLYATTAKGTKPDFHLAMSSNSSNILYQEFLEKLRKAYKPEKVKDGQFGAMMDVEIHNDGPVTIIVETPEKRTQSIKDQAKDERRRAFTDGRPSASSQPSSADAPTKFNDTNE